VDAFRSQGFTRFSPDWAAHTAFGDVAAAPTTVEPTGEHGSPPSSYAVLAFLDGRNGSVLRLVGLTLLRGAFIIPGLWVVSKLMRVDLGAYELIGLSFGGSATITAGMVGYYWIQRATGAIA
jgi:hypothetical protein